jgi:hypothetical protein
MLPSIFDSIQRSIEQGWPQWHILIYFLFVPDTTFNTAELYTVSYMFTFVDMTDPRQRKLNTVTLIEEKQIMNFRLVCNLLCNDLGLLYRPDFTAM